jgi:hypothetical protein
MNRVESGMISALPGNPFGVSVAGMSEGALLPASSLRRRFDTLGSTSYRLDDRPAAQTLLRIAETAMIQRGLTTQAELAKDSTILVSDNRRDAAPLSFGRDKDQAAAGLPPQRSLDDQLSSL